MTQHPTTPDVNILDALVHTPLGDFELIDFGSGRKLERWGDILVEYPDRLATGKPASEHWPADWVYVADVGTQAHWQPTRSGLSREWPVTVGGQVVLCRLDDRGRVGLRGREIPCAEWVRQRIEGCYDIDVIILPVPPVGHGPKGQMWDREVDMAKLVRYLPRLVTDSCLGVWLSTDSGAIAWKAEGLGQLLGEVLPGGAIEPLQLGVVARDGRVLPAGVAARWYDATEFLQTGGLPLTAAQLEERLDIHMISMGAAEEPAQALAEFSREQQDFVLHWVSIVTRTSSGMALNFVSHVCPALRLMDANGVEAWLLACMDIYDTRGLHPAVTALRDVGSFARAHKARSRGVAFDEVANVLEVFVQGLNGRRLKIACGEQCYTDTETIFLPASVSHYSDREDNFQLYKALVVHQWALTWFGSWRVELREVLDRYADPDAALACFHALETLRLDGCIRDTLPGVYRHLLRFRADSQVGMDADWQAAAERLAQAGAQLEDTLVWLQRLAGSTVPAAVLYQGVMQPDAVAKTRAARMEADKQAFRLHMLRLADSLKDEVDEPDDAEEPQVNEDGEVRLPFDLRTIESDKEAQGVVFEMQLDGRPIEPPDDVKGTMASIFQDLGEIPEEYLYAAGDGVYHAEAVEARSVEDVWKGTYHEEGSYNRIWCLSS